MKTVLKNGNVFYQNKIQKLDVEIDGETISQIGHDLDGENIIDCTDLLVTPGLLIFMFIYVNQDLNIKELLKQKLYLLNMEDIRIL